MHDVVGPADRVNVARARNALDLGFDRVRDTLQFVRAALLVFSPQRHRHGRHIVDALRLNQRLQYAAAGRLPVLVRIDRVIQAARSPPSVSSPTSNWIVSTAMPGRDTE